MLQVDPSLFQEIVTLDDFNALEPGAKGYIGFEPSGVPHIAQVLVTGERIRALAHAGVHMQILLADWHALINDKLGGDIDRIRESGELMKKSFQAVLQGENVEYLWATDLISREGYLQGLIKTAKATSLPRIRRALPIMGRTEADADSDFSKYIYPIMQANDIFMMDLDIAMGGMDQRHAHMLARDIAEKQGRKKFISLHTPLIGSLKGSGRMDSFEKMSKSDPEGSILVTDSPEDVARKIKGAFCPQGITDGNPMIQIASMIIIPHDGKIKIERPEKKGGPITVNSVSELETIYASGQIHPLDMKAAVTESLEGIMKKFKGILSEK